MQLTDRDYKILEFLTVAPSNSNIIADYLGASLQVVQRRLLKLFDNGYIKRERKDINSNYVYYIDGKKPRDLNHMLTLSKLYVYWIKKGYRVEMIKREVTLYRGIRSDGVAVVDRGNGLELIIIEVDVYTNPQTSKVPKYKGYKDNEGYKELVEDMPTILFITNKSVRSKDLDIEVLKLDFYEKEFQE